MPRKPLSSLVLLLLLVLCLAPQAACAGTDTQPQPPQEYAVSLATARGDVVQFTGDITVKAGEVVRGNVVAMSGDIDVQGRVLGNVTAMAGNIRLRSGSFVGGDVTTMAGDIQREAGSQVLGRIVSRDEIRNFGESYRYLPHNYDYGYPHPWDYHSPWRGFTGWLLSLLGMLALVAMAVAIFPEKLGNMKNSLESEPLRQLGIGLLGWIALPVVLLALVLTIIGIPVAVLALPVIPIVVLIGFICLALFAGQRLDQALAEKWPRFVDDRPLIQALKGTTLIWIARAIPMVGWLVWPLAALFGLGVVLTTRFGTNRPWPWLNPKGPGKAPGSPPAFDDTGVMEAPVPTGQPETPEPPDQAAGATDSNKQAPERPAAHPDRGSASEQEGKEAHSHDRKE